MARLRTAEPRERAGPSRAPLRKLRWGEIAECRVRPPGCSCTARSRSSPRAFAKGCPGNIAYCREPECKEKPKDETQIRLALQGSAIALQPLTLGFFAARLLFFSQYSH